jgi:hypothetical protein
VKKDVVLVCPRCGDTNEVTGSKTHHKCPAFDMQSVPFVNPEFKVRPWQNGFETPDGPMTSVSVSREETDPRLFAPFTRIDMVEDDLDSPETREGMRRGYGRQ